ncbi:MAG TPA: DUF1905 domain-containing protein [Mycobacteriales bacterium]|nr:DUF1905 domain-containing protein [Mycobacteriales bacterium]
MSEVVSFSAELWEHDGEGGWHFVSLPVDDSEELRARGAHRLRGFGSLRVRATVGSTSWTTSVFPSAAGPYVLPVKKPVRRAEELEAGDLLEVHLELLDL